MRIGTSDDQHPICAGTFRPGREQIEKLERSLSSAGACYECRCGGLVQYVGGVFDHWAKGCFDEPVYWTLDEYLAAGGSRMVSPP